MLILEPRPSRRARALLVAMYLIACGSLVLFTPGSLAATLCVVGAIAIVLEWRGSRPPVRIECRAGDEWWVEGEGPWCLRESSVLTTWLVLLVLDNGARRMRLPLWPDSLPVVQWRRLRSTLRQGGAEAPAP